MHDRDSAKPGTRFTSCGTCLKEFPAATAQESADLARAHVEAGCHKAKAIYTAQDLFPGQFSAVDDAQADLW